MTTPAPVLRRVVVQHIKSRAPQPVELAELYAVVEAKVTFDTDDLTPPMLKGKRLNYPRWKRNVRNFLQTDKEAGKLVNHAFNFWRLPTPLSKNKELDPDISWQEIRKRARLAMDSGGVFSARRNGETYRILEVTQKYIQIGRGEGRLPGRKGDQLTGKETKKNIRSFNASGGRVGVRTLNQNIAKEAILVALHPTLKWSKKYEWIELGEEKGVYAISREDPAPRRESKLFYYCMWERKLGLYALEKGDTVFIYDTKHRAIVCKTEVTKVIKNSYESKDSVRSQLVNNFGVDPVVDDQIFFEDKGDEGYFIAFRAKILERHLFVKKPERYDFPLTGWTRFSREKEKLWLFQAEGEANESRWEREGDVYDSDIGDERKRTKKEIVQREGQQKFRIEVLKAFNGQCAVTGCSVPKALEAAHIDRYKGRKSNKVENGLLLRADIHKLFDAGLVGINPDSFTLKLKPPLTTSTYKKFAGKTLRLGEGHKSALEKHWENFNTDIPLDG